MGMFFEKYMPVFQISYARFSNNTRVMKHSTEIDVYYVGALILPHFYYVNKYIFLYTDETVKDYKINYKP